MASKKCLGECGLPRTKVCAKSGKCELCCENECGCGFTEMATLERYDNLCESKYLRQQELPQ
jgi:hypothetical protein